MSMKIAVIGGGSWGTALSIHCARAGHRVHIWVYEKDVCTDIQESRENRTFLKGFTVPDAVVATNSLEESLANADIVLFSVPSEYSRGVMLQMKRTLERKVKLVIATKGIEVDSLKLMSEVALDVLGSKMVEQIAVLSGPSFAAEVAREDPTAVVISSSNPSFSELLQKEISFGSFRLYTNTDMIGVQLAGSIKNIIAIAAGIIEGIGFGHNTIAALITRGTSEIRRLGVAMGGRQATFAGLAGIGDLILTCTGKLSRNRQVGYRLGKGETLSDILSSMRMVAEGVKTAVAVQRLSQKLDIEMPISSQVYSVLHEQRRPVDAIQELLSRPLKEED